MRERYAAPCFFFTGEPASSARDEAASFPVVKIAVQYKVSSSFLERAVELVERQGIAHKTWER